MNVIPYRIIQYKRRGITVDALAHRVRNPRACGIEGIVYIKPHYRSIICVLVSSGSAVAGEELALARVISHGGSGMVVQSRIGIQPECSANAGRWLVIIESPVHQPTRHQDHRRRRSKSRFCLSKDLHRAMGILCTTLGVSHGWIP